VDKEWLGYSQFFRFSILLGFAVPFFITGGCATGGGRKMIVNKPMESTLKERERPIEIIAHRGASALAPENTLCAFRLAYSLGAPTVECDVHLTQDGRVIVHHDESTKRTTGQDLLIRNTTSEELKRLDAGQLMGEMFTGERIPFLEEALAVVPAGRRFCIEIKCGVEALPTLEEIINKSGKRKQVVIIGFSLDTVSEAKRRMPDIPMCWLRSTEKEQDTKKPLPHRLDWIQEVKRHKLEGLNVNWQGVTPEFIEAAHRAGLKVIVWTVDEPDEALRLRHLGVDGLATNKPDVILQAIR
jgi:glycerophosphoryl diester phosphodiesterase